MTEYNSIEKMFEDFAQYNGIHIECNQVKADQIYRVFHNNYKEQIPSYILETDRGYLRHTVKSYLKFFEHLAGKKISYKEALKKFELEKVKNKSIRSCNLCEIMKLNFARISLFDSKLCFLEDPLLNLDSESLSVVLQWIEEQCQKGVKFVTTSQSLRHALLMPGTVFYLDENRLIEVEQDQEPEEMPEKQQALNVYKISVKAGVSTLLFDPKDIDYIESMNKANYIFVRNSLYQTTLTLDVLENDLKDFGFFRCHRSYIVNVQKVEEIQRWTKNSFSLRLNNEQHSQLPLSKGRIDEMKATFNW